MLMIWYGRYNSWQYSFSSRASPRLLSEVFLNTFVNCFLYNTKIQYSILFILYRSKGINSQLTLFFIYSGLGKGSQITENKCDKEVTWQNEYYRNLILQCFPGEEEACMAVLNNFYGDGKLWCFQRLVRLNWVFWQSSVMQNILLRSILFLILNVNLIFLQFHPTFPSVELLCNCWCRNLDND